MSDRVSDAIVQRQLYDAMHIRPRFNGQYPAATIAIYAEISSLYGGMVVPVDSRGKPSSIYGSTASVYIPTPLIQKL